MDVEDRQQLRDVEQFAEIFCDACQADVATLVAGGGVRGNQSAQSGAVNVADVGKVKHQALFSLRQELLNRAPQLAAFVAQRYATRERQDGRSIDFLCNNVQCHFTPPEF